METIVNPTPTPTLTLYFCNICKTKPDQLSHHKAHLTTQKHIFRKKCFETCINTSFMLNRELIVKRITGEDKTRIDQFEKDTGLQFIKGDRASHDAIRDWTFACIGLLNDEFPNAVIPLDINFDTEENYKNSVIKMIDLNETLIVKNEEPEKMDRIEIKNIVQNIENYDIDFFVNMALKTPEPYVIALILYKQNYQSIYLKHVQRDVICNQKTYKVMKFINKAWAYKDINNDGNSNEIASNLRKMISTNVSDIFTEKIKEIPNEYYVLLEFVNKFKLSMFKSSVMSKLESLFRL
jgi:hypothetical protein